MPESPSLPRLPQMSPSVAIGKSPGWSLDRRRHRPCPVCHTDPPQAVCQRPDGMVVAQCPACAMTYLPEVPAEEDLEAFYRDYANFKGLRPVRRTLWRRFHERRFPDPFIEILQHSGGLRGLKLCEVGCSYGHFLARGRDLGAQVLGIELDEDALRHLRAEGMAAAAALPADLSCDIVCAFQLIEHLTDPRTFVRAAAAALQPDGRLLLALPNGGEWERVGPGWIGFRVDLEHVNYFSIRTLAQLLNQEGLFVEQFWEYLQARLPRTHAAPRDEGPLARRWRQFQARMHCQPYHADGSYVLAVLARKAVL